MVVLFSGYLYSEISSGSNKMPSAITQFIACNIIPINNRA